MAPEYPNEASRQYWEQLPLPSTPPQIGGPAYTVGPGGSTSSDPSTAAGSSAPGDPPSPSVVGPSAPLPGSPTQLANVLNVNVGAAALAKNVNNLYRGYVIPTQTRAQILNLLAGVAGFTWRGEVTDRAGRNGVAITADDPTHDQQMMLIFNPTTGELLAHEDVRLQKPEVLAYTLFVSYDRTDQPN